MIRNILLVFCFIFLFANDISAQRRYYVSTNTQTSLPLNGLSWNSAFNRLNDALNLSTRGDEIWIAKGTYFPTENTIQDSSFILKSGVALYGGFGGKETKKEQRNWNTNKTILSGDIGVKNDTTDNSYNVLYLENADSTTIIDGLTITNGNARNTDNLIQYDARPKSGGGIYILSLKDGVSNPKIRNCYFFKNSTMGYGGAIFYNRVASGHSFINVQNCLFEENIAWSGANCIEKFAGPDFGGTDEIINNTFKRNRCRIQGVCVYNGVTYANLIFKNCNFIKNESSNLTFKNFSDSAKYIIDNIMIDGGNFGIGFQFNKKPRELVLNRIQATKCGGVVLGLSMEFKDTFHFSITNSLFYHNENKNFTSDGAVIGVGSDANLRLDFSILNSIFYSNPKNVTVSSSYNRGNIINCIIKENKANLTDCILTSAVSKSRGIVFKNCLTDSKYSENSFGHKIVDIQKVKYNSNPQFRDTLNHDYHLLPCSPAINAGTLDLPDEVKKLLQTDLDGKPRIVSDSIDIGAYEYRDMKASITANPIKCGGDLGAMQVNAMGACLPLKINWLRSDGKQDTTTQNLAAGSYQVRVKDVNNSYMDLKVQLIEQGSVVAFSAEVRNPTSALNDGSVTLYNISGGTSPYTYAWSNGATTTKIENLAAAYYTVTVTDKNGCTTVRKFKVGNPIATNDVFLSDASIYPNPVEDELYIQQINNELDNIKIDIYNLQGALLLSSAYSKEGLDVSFLPQGIYFLQCTNGMQQRVMKMLKN